MEGNIEDMVFTLEVGGQPAELGMLFGEQDLVPSPGQAVGGGQSAQAAADDDDVVAVLEHSGDRSSADEQAAVRSLPIGDG